MDNLANKKINIWYCHPYAGSPTLGMSYRPYYLSKYINNNPDLNCTIISSSFHHLYYQPSEIDLKDKQDWGLATEDGVSTLYLKTPIYEGNYFARLKNHVTYGLQLLKHHKAMSKAIGRPDIIIASSPHPFYFFAAKRLAKKYKAKLIFEVRDLWPLSLNQLTGMSSWHPLSLLLSYIEKKAYHSCDATVSLLSNGFEHMKKRGLSEEKYHFIANGAVIEQDNSQDLPEILRNDIKELKNKGHFLIAYTGAHGVPNSLWQLLDALNIIQNKSQTLPVTVLCLGSGVEKDNLMAHANALGLKNIIFYPAINKASLPEFYQYMDALFISWQNKSLYQYGISPNKLYDYMLAAKPIIHCVNTVNDPVQLAECGIVTPPESPELLAQSMIELVNLNQSIRITMGVRGREYVCQYHDYQVLAAKYVDLFESLVKNKINN